MQKPNSPLSFVAALFEGRKRSATKVIAGIVLLTISANCNRTEKAKGDDLQRREPVGFSDLLFTEVTPTVDGGAYAIGLDSGLWYLRESEAVMVRFQDLAGKEADAFFLGLRITPLADGGAIAYSETEKSLWYLREEKARKVIDVPALTTKPISGPVSAFPLYVTEREKRLRAEKAIAEREEAEADSERD